LHGIAIDVNPLIDALPILAVLGCFAKGETFLYNAGIARAKESDRLAAITKELRKMGATIIEEEESLLIKSTPLFGAALEGHNDHRIAMALVVAARRAFGKSTIAGIECIQKSYPNFTNELACIIT
ncbi:MAG: 3-phosphoshikimate 1-carboxyvinyltransferase, partial [Chlamydiales bacterium]